MHYPSPKNPFLYDLINSIKKRNKALKNKITSIECERVIIRQNGVDSEKIEVEIIISYAHGKLPLSFHAWEDRWFWIDTRHWANRTWNWEWSCEGRMLPLYSGKDIVASIEKTIATTYGMNKQNVDAFAKIWKMMIAQGPTLINPHRTS